MPEAMIQPLPEAVAKLGARTPVGAKLRSAEWAEVPLALRERAQFSAAVESVRLLDGIQRKLQKQAGMLRERVARGEAFVDRDSFIADIRALAEAEGVVTTGARGAGTVRDIRSNARLGLIFDMQTRQSFNYARYKMDQDKDVLNAYPAQRLIRSESRREPRDWADRWRMAGGRVGWEDALQTPMVALKTSPIWAALSRFGTPWPPFDFGSGMGLEDVDRAEAVNLGLLADDQEIKPSLEDFNADLEASVRGLGVESRRELLDTFGDQVQIQGDFVRWKPDGVAGYVQHALRVPQAETKAFGIGLASRRVVEQSKNVDLAGTKLSLEASRVRHVLKGHGPKSRPSATNIPLDTVDLRQLPGLWRSPDRITYHGEPGVVVLWREYPDKSWLRAVIRKTGPNSVLLMTMNKTPIGPDSADGRSAHGNPDGKPPETTSET